MTSMGQEKMTQTLPPVAGCVTIGIDVGKDNLDAHLLPDNVHRRFPNSEAGCAALIAWVAPRQPSRVVFEATGAYHRGLEQALGRAGLAAVKVNPWQARRFAEATGTRLKTDTVDAAMLARFGATLQPPIPPARSAAIDVLQELQTARDALVKDRTAALNRAKTLTLPLLVAQNRARLQAIDDQLHAIDQERQRHLDADPDLQQRCAILTSIPGLAMLSALRLITEMPELGSLGAKQAASLAGLAPVTRQSGQWQGKSRIQGGRAGLRRALYMPALVAVRFNPDMKATYQALRRVGKPGKVAIVAVMRKLVVLANTLLRSRRCWTKAAPVG